MCLPGYILGGIPSVLTLIAFPCTRRFAATVSLKLSELDYENMFIFSAFDKTGRCDILHVKMGNMDASQIKRV